MSQAHPTTTLYSLPDEILGQIVGSFCTHCSRDVDTWFDGHSTPAPFFIYGYRPDRNRPAIQTLRNLCLVSRRIGNVAQEYLYHAPPLGNDDSVHSFKLHKTFRERPDLMSHIRLLPFFPRVASVSNILANSGNLEVMLVQPGNKIFSNPYWEVSARDGGYPKLTTFVFAQGSYGFDHVRYDKLLPNLSQSAPNLKVLDLHFTKRVIAPSEDLTLPNVTKLVLRGIDSPYDARALVHYSIHAANSSDNNLRNIDALVQAVPSMDDFTFEWHPLSKIRRSTMPLNVTPFNHVLNRCLDSHKNKLRRLTLVAPCLREGTKNMRIESMVSLQDFSALEVFVTDNCFIGLCAAQPTVYEAIPTQIKELWIYHHKLSTVHVAESGDEILDGAALKTTFPRLERVGIGGQKDGDGNLMGRVDKNVFGQDIEAFQLPDWDRRM